MRLLYSFLLSFLVSANLFATNYIIDWETHVKIEVETDVRTQGGSTSTYNYFRSQDGDFYCSSNTECILTEVSERDEAGDYTVTYITYSVSEICPPPLIKNPDTAVCEEPPPCNDEVPEGYVDYPINPVGGCATYEFPLTRQYSQGGGEVCDSCVAPPFTPDNCNLPRVWSESGGYCYDPSDIDDDGILNADDPDIDGDYILNENDPDIDGDGNSNASDSTPNGDSCLRLSEDILPLSKNICSGDNVYLIPKIYASITFQDCDNTCYGLESISMTCDQIGDMLISSCDRKSNDFLFFCDDKDPSAFNSSCSPSSTPCNRRYKEVEMSCEENEIMDPDGKCEHNGMNVYIDTLKCISSEPVIKLIKDCSETSYEVLDSSLNSCVCMDGYFRDPWGDCWKTLDETATDEEKLIDAKNQQDYGETNDQNEFERETTLNSLNSLDSLEASLSGIRGDNAQTNDLLSQINDTLSDMNGKLDGNGSGSSSGWSPWGDETEITDTTLDGGDNSEANGDLMNAIAGAKSGLSQISTDYETLLSKLDSGMDIAPSTSGSSPIFSAEVFHQTLSINLCDTFSKFYPVMYYVFTMMFLYFGVRIFIFSFMMGW